MWTSCTGGPNFGKRQYSGLIVPFLLLHARVREVRDNDELGVTPRQRGASSIIHLSNKLINSVNEEEQRGLKEPFSGWWRSVAHINQPGTQLWSLRQPLPPQHLSTRVTQHLLHPSPPVGKKILFHHRLMWAAALDAAHASEYNDIPVQQLYIKFVQDTSGMNYHLVATVTPLTQETPRCVLKEIMIFFCDLILKNHPSDDREERKSKGTRRRKHWEKGGTKKEGGEWGEAWLAAIGSRASHNLGHSCRCVSARGAETPHLPFISFPF